MWKISAQKNDNGTFNVTATFTAVDGNNFSYGATLKQVYDEGFAAKCMYLLEEFTATRAIDTTEKEKLEAFLNKS